MFTSDIIARALEEDIGQGDRTTDALIPETLQGRGKIVAKEDLLLAGAGVAGGVFSILDPKLKISQSVSDGERVKKGVVILQVEGSYRSLLKGERVALNFLQRLSGIATLTRAFVDQTRGTSAKILDTRKTIPLFRHLDKYAVRVGGGVNHRLGLFDGLLIKNNHISASGSAEIALQQLRKTYPDQLVVVEISKVEEIEKVLSVGVSRLLLDNMSDPNLELALKKINGRAKVEVSGGVTLERVEKIAKLGVDFISVGALTHSPRAVDFHFRIEKS